MVRKAISMAARYFFCIGGNTVCFMLLGVYRITEGGCVSKAHRAQSEISQSTASTDYVRYVMSFSRHYIGKRRSHFMFEDLTFMHPGGSGCWSAEELYSFTSGECYLTPLLSFEWLQFLAKQRVARSW